MVAPWLSWSTAFCTAAGSSERFSFFSFSCAGVCCVATCDVIAQVKTRRGAVHLEIGMTILAAVGTDSILSRQRATCARRIRACLPSYHHPGVVCTHLQSTLLHCSSPPPWPGPA